MKTRRLITMIAALIMLLAIHCYGTAETPAPDILENIMVDLETAADDPIDMLFDELQSHGEFEKAATISTEWLRGLNYNYFNLFDTAHRIKMCLAAASLDVAEYYGYVPDNKALMVYGRKRLTEGITGDGETGMMAIAEFAIHNLANDRWYVLTWPVGSKTGSVYTVTMSLRDFYMENQDLMSNAQYAKNDDLKQYYRLIRETITTPTPTPQPTPEPMTVGKVTYRLSKDKQSIYLTRPPVYGGSGQYTVAYNIYDSNSNPVNYFYSTEAEVAATPGYGGLFNVFIVVNDVRTGETNTQDIGWQKLNWPYASKLKVGKASFELSSDGYSIFIDRPEIKCKSGDVTIAYNIYDQDSNPVNYFYSTESRVAASPGYDGKFNVFIVVTDPVTGETNTQNIGWQQLGVTIETQPEDLTASVGEQVTLSVEAKNVKSYLWQYSYDDGATWKAFTSGGHNTAKLTYTVESKHFTRLIRCKLTGLKKGVIYTNAVKLYPTALLITEGPQECTAAVGEKVTLTVKAENVKKYLWQYSYDEGETWKAFTTGGHNTDQLTYTVERKHYTRLIRCKLTGFDDNSECTYSVRLLCPEIVITTQPQTIKTVLGETITESVTATNAVKYLWQYSYDQGTTWNDCKGGGFNTNAYTFTVEEKHYDRLLRCRLQAHDGSFAYTMTAAIKWPDLLANGTCGDDIRWWLVKNSGMLYLSGSGAISEAPWGSVKESITGIEFFGTISSIGDRAFENCTGLTSVSIPNSVTSIGKYAFYLCTGLTSVSIPNSVTSIGDYAFDACSSLTSITIPSGVTSIEDATFAGCKSLISITIPDSVTSIGNNAFSTCRSLTSVTIPNSVTSIGDYAFLQCSSLTSISIPDSVTCINSSLFRNCTSLTSVSIPNGVTSIGDYAFDACSSLTSITIPDNVTSIGKYAFRNCTGLTSIIIGNGLTSIDSFTFSNYPKLTNVVIGNSVESIDNWAFSGCSKLVSVTIGNSVTSIGSYAFKGCASLTSITIPNSVTNIGEYAFSSCNGLTSIIIGNSVKSIGDSTFSGCSKLASVTIGNSVTSIGQCAFYGCTGLTSITIPDSVTSIGWAAFYNCTGLTSITIPNSVTSIGSVAFYGCTNLATARVPSGLNIPYGAFPSTTTIERY